MHDEIDRLRIKLGDGANVLLLALFGKCVTGKVGVVFLSHSKEEIVDRIGEVEQTDVALQFEL